MTAAPSFGDLDFTLVSERDGTGGKPAPDTPFRILILGDFSGRTHGGAVETGDALAARRVRQVDRDNLDETLAALKVRLSLPGLGPGKAAEVLSFTSLEDFHPDQIFARLGIFKVFQAARKKAQDPQELAKVMGSLPARQEVPPKPEAPSPKVPAPSSTPFLDQVMEATAHPEGEEKSAHGRETEWDQFLHDLVAPHTLPDTADLKAQLTSKLDEAAGDMMRAVLHYPTFQQLEAIWRGLSFLVRRVETDEALHIHLIDISKEALRADLRSTEDLSATGIYKLLVENTVQTPGADPWSLLVGGYRFGPETADLEVLGRMAKIARRAGAPFIAAADDALLGCERLAQAPDPSSWPGLTGSPQEAWEALRQLPEAHYLGLALPGFLLRLPYGTDTEPTERFDFEEMSGSPRHENYLWGNPAFACACLLAQAFSRDGWEFRPGTVQDLDRLPLHLYTDQGESVSRPCAELLLTERAAVTLLDTGLMPLAAFKDQDRVRLVRFQSVAKPLIRLAGPWQDV
jgi:type VI secretion system protein ImpC